MEQRRIQQIIASPEFQKMAQKKRRLAAVFSIVVLIMYFSFISLVSFNKDFISSTVSAGMSATYGVYIGIGICVLMVILTGIYAYKANGEFEALTQEVIDKVRDGQL